MHASAQPIGFEQVAAAPAASGAEAYRAKDIDYFAGVRLDFLHELPADAQAKIVEIGCGSGGTGELALKNGKCGYYCGVDIDDSAVKLAESRISQVVLGDIEKIDLPWPAASFDVLILSEVLEHLCDPLAALRKLRPLLKPGALIMASSPNVAHYKVIRMLLGGEWKLEDWGTMDRTHLRWFTPGSYRKMFEDAGFGVESVGQVERPGLKARLGMALLGAMGQAIFTRQISLRARCPGGDR